MGNVKIIVALRAILINKFQFANLPFEREEIFSQRAFSIYCLENKGYIIWKLDKKERTYLVFDEQGN